MAGTLTVQTLQGPSSGANANKVLIPSGQTLYAPGHVIQVVSQQYGGTAYFVYSTTFSDIVSLSITPKSTSSKIICTINGCYQLYGNSNSPDVGSLMRLLRNGTDISAGNSTWSGINSLGNSTTAVLEANQSWSFDDSPSSTSSVTYTWQHKVTVSNVRAGFVQNLRVELVEIAQ